MCGITGFLPDHHGIHDDVLNELLKYNRLRGNDAFGYIVYDLDTGIINGRRNVEVLFSEQVLKEFTKHKSTKSLILGVHRAAPETEIDSFGVETIQPIMSNGIILAHNGSVSNFIYNEVMKGYDKISELDSEAIIAAYLKHNRDIIKTMEYLSGGFAFLMIDILKEKLYAVCTHNPLYCGYVRGYGTMFSSVEEGLYKAISKIKGTEISRMNISRWEDYYVRQLPEHTITEFDIHSTMINEHKFTPRYIHPNYDPYKSPGFGRSCVLVSASGGLDSTTALACLKYAGYKVKAVHFKYGHRGQDAEEIAIEHICEELNIELIKFDIEANMKMLDDDSMLTNKDHEITTGTDNGLKTTVAWTCFRNGFFVTYMGALAEKLIVGKVFDEVYITGGFLNLTESGVYSDNSERFISAFDKFTNFASIVGTKMKPLYGLCNILKSEQYYILDKMGLLDKLGKWMVSCDRPTVYLDEHDNLLPLNCSSKDTGLPACGSGLLSYWAAKLANVNDPRRYYTIDEKHESYTPKSRLTPKHMDINNIVDRIAIDEKHREILRSNISKLNNQK